MEGSLSVNRLPATTVYRDELIDFGHLSAARWTKEPCCKLLHPRRSASRGGECQITGDRGGGRISEFAASENLLDLRLWMIKT